MDRSYDVIAFISQYLYFKKIQIMNQNVIYIYFLIYQNLLFSGEKMLMSTELKGYVTE